MESPTLPESFKEHQGAWGRRGKGCRVIFTARPTSFVSFRKGLRRGVRNRRSIVSCLGAIRGRATWVRVGAHALEGGEERVGIDGLHEEVVESRPEGAVP